MKYLVMLFMIACNYYTFTYGLYLWKKEKNKTGSVAVIILSLIGAIIPSITLLIKYQ